MKLLYQIKDDKKGKDNSIKLTISVTTPDIKFKDEYCLKLDDYIHYIFNVGSKKEAMDIVKEFRTRWTKLDKNI